MDGFSDSDFPPLTPSTFSASSTSKKMKRQENKAKKLAVFDFVRNKMGMKEDMPEKLNIEKGILSQV